MKKIYIILATLFILVSGMSYVYFSNLNSAGLRSDMSLKFVAKNAGLVFSFHNEKSVVEILKGQSLFNKIMGADKAAAFEALRTTLDNTEVNGLFQDQNVFIGFYPGKKKDIDFVISMQINPALEENALWARLKIANLTLKPRSTYFELQLQDSSTYYLSMQKRVVLIANSASLIEEALSDTKKDAEDEFIAFIQKNDRLSKNSLANLYINHKKMPGLMKSITPYFNRGELSILNNQEAYARMTYNFSKEKVYFSGETQVLNAKSYFSLFTALKPEKIALDKILPANTANFTLYAFGDYQLFHKSLQKWFIERQEEKNVRARINGINQQYRVNLDDIFLKYINSQAITFQLENKQKLAAIKLNDGDKVEQLLLDLSNEYDENIRMLKEPDLLYYYFGEPFKKFEKPYYLILNNCLIVAPYASSLKDFRNSYQNSQLLIEDRMYNEVLKQLPSTANILFYLNNNRSQDIIINTIYPDYYRQYRSDDGMKFFNGFVYQLSGDQGSFQTNILLNSKHALLDSVAVNLNSLKLP